MYTNGVQGKKDQFVFSCCAAQHEGKQCFFFGTRIDDDGNAWALISPWVKEVPAEELVVYSRKKSTKECWDVPESGIIPIVPNE